MQQPTGVESKTNSLSKLHDIQFAFLGKLRFKKSAVSCIFSIKSIVYFDKLNRLPVGNNAEIIIIFSLYYYSFELFEKNIYFPHQQNAVHRLQRKWTPSIDSKTSHW